MRVYLFVLLLLPLLLPADDGYRLWLRYDRIADEPLRQAYAGMLGRVYVANANHPVLRAATDELHRGLSGLLGQSPESVQELPERGIILGVAEELSGLVGNIPAINASKLKAEGYRLFHHNGLTYVVGRDERGVLYGAFALLRQLQRGRPLEDLRLVDNPRYALRLLNHWDNLDGTVERGYAGGSIWNWHQLPDYLDPRYTDYARANASVGINGAVVTNVNAKAIVLRADYLEKAAALAGVFRPHGIRLYLTARFSAPMELGGLDTADPLDPAVQAWWRDKVEEIYAAIPDFGGFVVKANSEGQPGPREYGRSHAEGANLLADALAPHGGTVMWRAFVYSEEEPTDRAKQAYDEFVPLDGQFRDNVLVQVKNGPIDFQPREPVHPLFSALPGTPTMLELQITKEYLGQGTHLVGLGNLYSEVLHTDTYAEGRGTPVASLIDGMAGVANIGATRNWTGNLFGQADWYTFGRLAWNPDVPVGTLFREWAEQTFPGGDSVQRVARSLLDRSYDACVSYMTPLGLHHIMGPDHHYGPGPWVSDMPRADWTSVYYHQADTVGIGFDRTATGSNALEQYPPTLAARYADPETCPRKFLLWFHHLPWDYEIDHGVTLWERLCRAYDGGAQRVTTMRRDWEALAGQLDEERYRSVLMHLNIQEREARWWRDACLSYFQAFSRRPIPSDLKPPAHDLEYYQSLSFPYAPGIRPQW